jgi:hypothetical protein
MTRQSQHGISWAPGASALVKEHSCPAELEGKGCKINGKKERNESRERNKGQSNTETRGMALERDYGRSKEEMGRKCRRKQDVTNKRSVRERTSRAALTVQHALHDVLR